MTLRIATCYARTIRAAILDARAADLGFFLMARTSGRRARLYAIAYLHTKLAAGQRRRRLAEAERAQLERAGWIFLEAPRAAHSR